MRDKVAKYDIVKQNGCDDPKIMAYYLKITPPDICWKLSTMSDDCTDIWDKFHDHIFASMQAPN